jgi:ERCC4-type nuclease
VSLDPDRFRAGSVRFPWARDAVYLPLPVEGVLTVLIDTRESAGGPPLPKGCVYRSYALETGDYSTPALLGIATIERKTPSDFCSTVTHGRERFDREVERMQAYEWKAVVVEGSFDDCLVDRAVHPSSLVGSVASLYARHDIPCFFAGNAARAGRLIAGLLRRWEERARPLPEADRLAELRAAAERILTPQRKKET